MKLRTLIIFFITISSFVYARNDQITGVVIDCASQSELSYVNVRLLGLNKATLSDEHGRFVIDDVPNGDYVLTASSMGYEEARLQVVVDSDKESDSYTMALCEESFDLSQLVVTATRTERLLKNVPIQTQLITSKNIERLQVTNFKDLLEYELSGVEFTNNGGFANINMLGFGGKYVLFLVDGDRMAGETFDNIDYNRIDMDNVQQVEIVKGAASSLYGSNAVGGVINIITQKPSKPFESSANVRYGSNNEQSYQYTVGSKKKWGYLNLASSCKGMSPYLLVDTEPQVRKYENGDSEALPMSETYIAGFNDFSITPRIGVNVNKKLDIEGKAGFYFKQRNPGGLEGTKVNDLYYDYSASLKSNYIISEASNISLSYNFDNYDKYKNYIIVDEKEWNYQNSQHRLNGMYNLGFGKGHSLVAGAEYFTDNLMTYMFESDGQNSDRTMQSIAAYSQQEWMLSDKLTLVSGFRYDYNTLFNGHFTPRLSFMYKPIYRLTLRGGYSGGFRSPTLKELYTDWFHPNGGGFQIIGNRDMKAEISNNFNLSSELSLGKTVITAIAQYSMIDDMVSTVWVNNDTVRYANIGAANILSTEFAVTSQINKNLSLKANYSYVQDNLGKKSLVRPHSATLRANYMAQLVKNYNSTFSISGKLFSGMDIWGTGDDTDIDDEIGIEKEITNDYFVHYDAYSVWRFTFSQQLPYNITLNAGINNLFNYKTKFSSFYSSISPGRTYYIGFKWKI